MRIGASVTLKILFDAVQRHDADSLREAYILAGIIGCLWTVAEIAKQNFTIEVLILFARIRAQLVFLSFKKLMTLSAFNIKFQETGKIINILISDFNSI